MDLLLELVWNHDICSKSLFLRESVHFNKRTIYYIRVCMSQLFPQFHLLTSAQDAYIHFKIVIIYCMQMDGGNTGGFLCECNCNLGNAFIFLTSIPKQSLFLLCFLTKTSDAYHLMRKC